MAFREHPLGRRWVHRRLMQTQQLEMDVVRLVFTDPEREALFLRSRFESVRRTATLLSYTVMAVGLAYLGSTMTGMAMDDVAAFVEDYWATMAAMVIFFPLILFIMYRGQPGSPLLLPASWLAFVLCSLPQVITHAQTRTALPIVSTVFWLTGPPSLLAERYCTAMITVPTAVIYFLALCRAAPRDSAIGGLLYDHGGNSFDASVAIFVLMWLTNYYVKERRLRIQFVQKQMMQAANMRLETQANPFSLKAVRGWFQRKHDAPEGQMDEPLLQERPADALEQWDISYADLKLKRIVGAGGSGRVFEGSYSGRTVAVKELFASMITPEELGEFATECRMLYRLRHPNIVGLFGICFHELRTFLVTEFLPYELTDLVLDHDDRLPPVLEMARQLAAGCKYMHAQGVVHCDLKPQNILLSETFELKVCDFGLSRAASAHNPSYLSSVGGTLQFMAPELFAAPPDDGLRLEDARKVDVYAFGIILWSMLAADLPFATSGWGEMMSIVTSGQRPEVREDWDGRLVELMRECWAAEPTERPDFAAICARLEGMRERQSLGLVLESAV